MYRTFSTRGTNGSLLCIRKDIDTNMCYIDETNAEDRIDDMDRVSISRRCDGFNHGELDIYLYDKLTYALDNRPAKVVLSRWYENRHPTKFVSYGDYYISMIIECNNIDKIKLNLLSHYTLKDNEFSNKYIVSGEDRIKELIHVLDKV